MSAIESSEDHRDTALLLLRWIRLLTSHLSSLHSLSRFFGKTAIDTTVQITMISVRPPLPKTYNWWSVLQRVIKGSIVEASTDRLQELLCNAIREAWVPVTSGARPRPPGIFKYFDEQTMTLCGTVHCEAALVAILKGEMSPKDKMAIPFDVSQIYF